MPVELRKRKAPEVAPAAAPPAKKKSAVSKVVEKVKDAISPSSKKATNGSAASSSSSKVAVGDIVPLDTFGGEIETNDGEKTTLKKLVDASTGGVVLFTYPKASTPGCTKQACLFRDSYAPLTTTGFSIFGLSGDSPKANTTFKTKQNLPYPLLCDPTLTLISAIGLKKAPKGTTRGVFVIDKSGKVLASEAGSPDGTVAVVKKLVDSNTSAPAAAAAPVATPAVPETKTEAAAPATNGGSKEDVEKAEVAAEVANTAEKLDSNEKPAAVAA